MKSIKKITIILIFISLTIFTASDSHSSKSSIKWYRLDKGLQKAKKLKKPVLVDFHADWCGWCKVMDKKTFSNQNIINKINKDYIAIKVKVDSKEALYYKSQKMTPQQFARKVGVQGLPAFLFIDKNGRIIRIVSGYQEAKIFLPILGYIKDECYNKNVPFIDYVKGKGKCK